MMDGFLAARFWTKVRKTSGCWFWIACKNRTGYGLVSVDKKSRLAHRIAWNLCISQIPNGKHILHTCDNPACVNPNHLYIGTPSDNVRDMMSRRRHYSFKGIKMPSGPQHHYYKKGPKLTATQAAEILLSKEKNYVLAKQYGVDPSLISKIKNGHNWNR